MKSPLVSVIMPAYNAEKYIGESIESVLSQYYADWELIIINDGSSDNTQVIIDKYKVQDNRIRSFYQDNAKQGKARNLGIQQAGGEYIAFLDADDIMFKDRLAYQTELMINSQFDMLFCNAYKFSYDYRNENCETFEIKNEHFSGNNALNRFLEMNPVPMLTVFIKKKVLEEVGCFSINPLFENAEDYHLWLKLLQAEKNIFSTDKIVGAYRLYEQSTTYYDGLSFVDSIFAITDVLNEKKEKNFLKKIFSRKKRIFIAQTRKMPREVYFKKAEKLLMFIPNKKLHFNIIRMLDILLGRKISRRYLSSILWF